MAAWIRYTGTFTPQELNEFEVPLQAGSRTLVVRFTWDSAVAEQYNLFVRVIEDKRRADPLLKGTEIIRDYDYLLWYLSLPDDLNELITQLNNGMEYPQSLRKLENEAKALNLQVRKEEAKIYKDFMQSYEQQLCWHLTVVDDEGYSVTGELRPGGWINNQSKKWRLRFNSERSKIGFSDLALCTVECVVYE